MTTDEEPRIRRRAPKPEKPGLRDRQLHGVIVTLDELKQVESIVRDFVAASPAQEHDYLTDKRSVEIEAGTAILPNVDLVRALKHEEVKQFQVAGRTNDFSMVGAYFKEGGDVTIIWDSGDEQSVAAADLIEGLLLQRRARQTRGQLRQLATVLSSMPFVLWVLYLYLNNIRVAPTWISLPLLIIDVPLGIGSWRLQKRASRPTIRNRTIQEIEDARRIPRAQAIAYAIGILGILVSIAVALTR